MPILSPPSGKLVVLDKEPESERSAPQQTFAISPQIPSELWGPIKDELSKFIREELNLMETERGDFIKKLARWDRMYDAPMPSGPKTFPFFGASNMTLPVIKEAVNTLIAQLVQSTLTARPYWIFQDLAPEWEKFIDEIQTFMDIAGDRDLHIGENAIPWIVEAAKRGTSILQVGYEVDEREQWQVSADGASVFPVDQIHADGPATYPMQLEDFWIRFGERDIQKARMVAKVLRYNEYELREKHALGKFPNKKALESVLTQEPESPSEPVKQKEEVEKTKPVVRALFEIFEVWVRWPLKKGAKKMTDLLIYYHRGSQTILGAEFHPYWHGKRPFIKLGYFPMEGRFYDQGLCEMLEQIQAAISETHNKRADNIALANMKMFLKRRGVRGLQPGDPLYPGKVIEVLDIDRDIKVLPISEVYPSTIQEEAQLQGYAQRLSGLNEGTMGSAMPVTRTTASAQIALLQEQTKRIDLTVRSIRRGLNEVGLQSMALYYQFGTNGKAIAWMGEKGKIVEAVFRLPKRVMELGLGLKVQVPTSMTNKQVQRENALAMYNLLNNMYEKMLPLVQALVPEQLPHVVAAMVSGSQKFLGDVLETFDVSDPEEALAGLAVLERVLPKPEDMGGMDSFARSVESAEVFDQLGRLEALYREAESAGRRVPGVSGNSGVPERTPPPAGQPSDISPDLLFGGLPGGGE